MGNQGAFISNILLLGGIKNVKLNTLLLCQTLNNVYECPVKQKLTVRNISNLTCFVLFSIFRSTTSLESVYALHLSKFLITSLENILF